VGVLGTARASRWGTLRVAVIGVLVSWFGFAQGQVHSARAPTDPTTDHNPAPATASAQPQDLPHLQS
jgi:hypothetical protein